MKISYRTHPILKYFNSGERPLVSVQPKDILEIKKWEVGRFYKVLDSVWDAILAPQKQVYIMAETFANAVEFSMPKLYDLGLHNEIQETSGVLCWGVMTIMYDIQQCKGIGIKKWAGSIIVFSNEHLALLYTDDKIYYCASGFKISPALEVVKSFISMILAVDMFKKYAEVETKILPPKSNNKFFNCKYVNETDSTVVHLNSTWYTTLVKTDGFMVRGHLRLQPCGEGLKGRKLIYIDPFMKTGYTAPARKLAAEQ